MSEDGNIQYIIAAFDSKTNEYISDILIIPIKQLSFIKELLGLNEDDPLLFEHELTLAQVARISSVLGQNITVDSSSLFFISAVQSPYSL
jgi:hypothetical protein